MKKILQLGLVFLLPWSGLAQDVGMREFQEIAARLDIGGDLFLVLHTGRWLDAVLSRMEGTEQDIPPASAEERDLREASGRMRRFAARHGISGLQGVGVSSAPLQGGMSNLKIFMLRDAQDANLPFWRGLFGWQPRRLQSLDYLPADTDFVWASTPDFGVLWQLLELAGVALQESSIDALQAQITIASERFVGQKPLPFLEGLRDEVLVALRSSALEGPDGGHTWEWLVVLGTGETVLFEAVKAFFVGAGVALENVAIGGSTLHRVRMGEGIAQSLPGQLAFAGAPGFFVLGSSSRIVEDALLSQRHRSGLLARPEFVDAFRGQNMVNNGVFYVSRRGAEALRDRQDARIRRALPATLDPFSRLLLEELGGEGASGSVLALTLANWRQGIMLSGRSGVGGTAMGSWLGSFPAGWWFRLPQFVERWVSGGVAGVDAVLERDGIDIGE